MDSSCRPDCSPSPISVLRRMRDDGTFNGIRRACADAKARKERANSTERGDFGQRLKLRLAAQGVQVGKEAARKAAELVEAEMGSGPLFDDLVPDESARRAFADACGDAVREINALRGVVRVHNRIVLLRAREYLTNDARQAWLLKHPGNQATSSTLGGLLRALRYASRFPFIDTNGAAALADEITPEAEKTLIDLVAPIVEAVGGLVVALAPVGAARVDALVAAKLLVRQLSPPGSETTGSPPGSGALPDRTDRHKTGHTPADVLRFSPVQEARYRRLIGDAGQTRGAADRHRGVERAAAASVPSASLALWAMTKYAAPGGLILDPFAGGPTRAVMVALAGYRYIGTDIRAEQVEFTNAHLRGLHLDHRAVVHHADAAEFDWRRAAEAVGGLATLVHTCPPYFDKERYSEDPHDLSAAATYGEFLHRLAKVIEAMAPALAPGARAAWVVAEFRDRTGRLRRFDEDVRRVLGLTGWITDERTITHERRQPPTDAGAAAARNSVVGKSEVVVVARLKSEPADRHP